MSVTASRGRRKNGSAGPQVPLIPATLNEGTCQDFLRRHEMEASRAARANSRQREAFAQTLLERAADTRNIRLAIEYVACHGGPAAGRDGMRLADLDNWDRWELSRVIRESF